MSDALYGFLGVIIGSITTLAATVYHERLATTREREQREQERRRLAEERQAAFERESGLALQAAVTDLLRAVYDEQDRQLLVREETGEWPIRTWETPTASGYSDAHLRLEAMRARIRDPELRGVARDIWDTAQQAIRSDLDGAKKADRQLEALCGRFHDLLNGQLYDRT